MQLLLIVGTPQAKCAPLSLLNGRFPETKEMTLYRKLRSANGLSFLGVIHFGVRHTDRNVGNHVGKKLHRNTPLTWATELQAKGTTTLGCPEYQKEQGRTTPPR